MIRARGLTKVYDDKIAVDGLNLDLDAGEILGFLGPNGAGKTTTVKLLTGMITATSGKAEVAGFDVARDPIEVKRRIGFVPESGAIYENLTAGEYLEMVASLHHLDLRAARARALEILDLFGIASDIDKRMTQYSKGMKQKVLLTAALVHDPDVLFLDEPLNGIDANSSLIIKELLARLAARGKAIFFSSHILDVVERVCTRIVIIKSGNQIMDGTPEEIMGRTGTVRLEEAFSKLTGALDIEAATGSFLRAVGHE